MSRRYGIVFAVGIGFLYLVAFPHFPRVHNANELPRVYLVQAIADEASFSIDTGVAKWGTTVDVSPGPRDASGHRHCYSNKAPGSSFLAVPPYLVLKASKAIVGAGAPTLEETLWLARFVTGVLPTLGFCLLLWRFLRRFDLDDVELRLCIAAYALGSMAMTYSVQFISHHLAAICVASAFFITVWIVEGKMARRWFVTVGALAGAAPLVDYQAAFAAVPVFAYGAWHTLLSPLIRKSDTAKPQWRPLILAGVGAVLPLALLFFYHDAAFGHPLRTGYAASETFAHFHQKGFLGMDTLRWEAFYGAMVSPQKGLLFFSPIFVLIVPGTVLLARHRQWWMLGVTATVVVTYILFVSALNFWRGGWTVGPRYITAMLPFAMVPVAMAVRATRQRVVLRGVAVGLAVVGIVVYTLSSVTYPHYPENFHNPLYQVTFALIGDGFIAPTLLDGMGLGSWVALGSVMLAILAVCLCFALPSVSAWRSAVVAVAVAASLFFAYRQVPSQRERPGGATVEKIEKHFTDRSWHPRVKRRCY